MATIKLLKYSNYFNRQIKVLDTLSDYDDYVVATFTNINFNPNDGINATQVLNTTASGDYLLVVNDDDTFTRWFIIESNRTRLGQYKVTLRRDVVSDYYDSILDAPCFIEKGTVPSSNPLVYNTEGLGFNQIKESETLLQDASQCPWIVGYIAKNASQPSITIDTNAQTTIDFINVAAADLTAWSYYPYLSTNYLANPYDVSYVICYHYSTGVSWSRLRVNEDKNMTSIASGSTRSFDIALWTNAPNWNYSYGDTITPLAEAIDGLGGWDTLIANIIDIADLHTASELSVLLSYNGKNIRFTDGSIYKITVNSVPGENETQVETLSDTSSQYFSMMSNAVLNSNAFNASHNVADAESFGYYFKAQGYRVYATPVTLEETTTKISDTRVHTTDAIYDIFCLPYGEIDVIQDSTTLVSTTADLELAAATSIATALGSSLYDIQVVPYCPMQNSLDEANPGAVITLGNYGINFDYITNGSGTNVGIVFYVEKSNFTFNITKEFGIDRPYSRQILDKPDSSLTVGFNYNAEYIIQTLDYTNSDYTSLNITSGISFSDGTIIVNKRSKTAPYDVIESYTATEVWLGYNIVTTGNNVFRFYDSATSSYIQVAKSAYENADYYYTFSFSTNVIVSNQPAWIDNDSTLSAMWQSVTKLIAVEYDHTYAEDIKLSNECDRYRLVSPNYQGEFEFSVAKNLGVSNFNVDCTYKPYNPYIHVNPDFKNLYGADFNDSRGLICNGDFSLGQLTDAFANYELNNKNYQAIFARQIENMDVNNKIAQTEAAIGAPLGALSTGLSAGIETSKFGVAAGVGTGIAAGIASGVAGAIDYSNLIKQQEEAKSYSYDMYNYNLQNIKAMPYSISRSTAITYNNKYFPFVEKYSCSDTEKEALLSKMKYEGMTVMATSTLRTYALIGEDSYIKGRLIRLSDITDDSQLAYAIYEEINKGVYL